MTLESLAAATPFIAWSRVWNLSVDTESVSQSWRGLDLPDSFPQWYVAFERCFGRAVDFDIKVAFTGDWQATESRLGAICEQMELSWDGVNLPREHLAAVCELMAYAIERGESALAADIAQEILLPWCEYAERQLVGEHAELKFLVDDFAQDVEQVLQGAGNSQ